MNKVRSTLKPILCAAIVAVPLVATASPLDPLVQFLREFDASLGRYVKTYDPSALQPFKLIRSSSTGRMRLQEQIRSRGVSRIAQISMEFELIFRRLDGSGYYMRSGVWYDGRKARFVYLEGRARDRTSVGVSGVPLENLRGVGGQLRRTAAKIIRNIRRGRCVDMPFATTQDLDSFHLPPKARKRLIRGLSRAKARLPRICQAIRTFNNADVRLRIDDQAHVIYDRDRRAIGILRSQFRILDDGHIGVIIDGIREF